MSNDYEITGVWAVLVPISDMIITILGMFMLAAGIAIISFVYWIFTNIVAIVAGLGCTILFIFFLGSAYSYFKDVKSIKAGFKEEQAKDLIISLRIETLTSMGKMSALMVLYGILWAIVIVLIKKAFGV